MHLIHQILFSFAFTVEIFADEKSKQLNVSREGCFSGQENTLDFTTRPSLQSPTRFKNPSSRREKVTTEEMVRAALGCEIENLGKNQVSWIRLKDNKTIDVRGPATQKMYVWTSNPELWYLVINTPRIQDSGEYECQVNSYPQISMVFSLQVYANSCGLENTTNEYPFEVYFTNISKRNITTLEGQATYLGCGIEIKQHYDHKISWVRKIDAMELTARSAVCINNTNYEPVFSYSGRINSTLYKLKIKSPQLNDSGIYLCQIYSKPIKIMEFQLTVKGNTPAAFFFTGGYWAQISDWPTFNSLVETKVVPKLHESAFLHCSVKNLGSRDISWVKMPDMVTICNTTYMKSRDISCYWETDFFVLEIFWPTKQDSGAYECQVETTENEPKMKKTFQLKICSYPLEEGNTAILCNSVSPKYYLKAVRHLSLVLYLNIWWWYTMLI